MVLSTDNSVAAAAAAGPKQMAFSPFTDNGGTTLAISGKDYCLIASDTRLSEGYSIHSRYQPHTFKLNETTIFSGSGMYADCLELQKQVKLRLEWYRHQHQKEAGCENVAQLIATMLFFPYYVFTVLGGLDKDGKGCVFSFDPVGSYERESCRAGGASASIIQPFLDNQVKKKNLFKDGQKVPYTDLPLEEAIKLAKDAFAGATERQIYTGDYLEIFIVTKQGVEVQRSELKKD